MTVRGRVLAAASPVPDRSEDEPEHESASGEVADEADQLILPDRRECSHTQHPGTDRRASQEPDRASPLCSIERRYE